MTTESLFTKEGVSSVDTTELTLLLVQAITQRIDAKRYDLWFRERTKFSWADDQLTVGVPNRFFQEWLQKTFAKDVAAAAADVFDQPMHVRFVIDPQLFQAARQAEAQLQEPPPEESADPKVTQSPPATAKPAPKEKPAPRKPQPKRRWHRLKDFVVGPCNRVAQASALAVIDNPGLEVNPLVLHGPVGTGKTHLLEAIYVELRKAYGHWRICFATSEEFTNRFVQAMRLGKLPSFRKQFRHCDALLIDDLHFLASKRATQEEFLHTFDVLQAEGHQMVLTCDCHPRLNEQYLPELVDRLLGGAIWSVMPPDFDTRLNLLRAKCLRDNQPLLAEDVLIFIADQLRGNVRELEGALNSIYHFSRVAKRKIDVPLVREALGDLIRHSIRVIQMPEIDEAICTILGLSKGTLQSKNRSWAVSHPRMLAMFLSRKHTNGTYTEIGRYFGNKSHSTVVAAEKKVRLWLQENHMLALGKKEVRVRDVVEKAEHELLG